MGIFYGIVAAVLIAVGTASYAFVTGYAEQATELEQLRHKATLTDQRLASNQRMIDRRNAAINASQCKTQIEFWIKNPDDLPQPFKPFGNQVNR